MTTDLNCRRPAPCQTTKLFTLIISFAQNSLQSCDCLGCLPSSRFCDLQTEQSYGISSANGTDACIRFTDDFSGIVSDPTGLLSRTSCQNLWRIYSTDCRTQRKLLSSA